MNVFITAYFYVYKSRFPRVMFYCPIIKVDFAALAASLGSHQEHQSEMNWLMRGLTISLLFCTQNLCCKLLGISFKLHMWAEYQVLLCLA